MSKTQKKAIDIGLYNQNGNDNSPKNSQKDSFGSQDSNLSFEKYDVDMEDKDIDRFKYNMQGFEARTSAGTFNESGTFYTQEIDDFDSLKNDPIFQGLCPKDQYEDSSTCKVCGKGFSKIKLIAKKNCKFCGCCVCEEHSKKKRPDPKNTSDYVRVCDTCDEKWINRTILGEFYEKLKAKEKEIEILEKQIREQQMKIENEQKEHDSLVLTRNRNEKNYTDQINILQTEIQKVKEETKKCEKENAELSKEFSKTQDKVTELDNEINKAEDEYKKLSKEATELTYKIEALNLDIAQINREIRNIEEYITQNKANGGYYDDKTLRGTELRGEGMSFRDQSAVSSVVSEIPDNNNNTGGNKKSHYNKKNAPRGGTQTSRNNKGDQQRSANCDVGCNMF